MLPDGESVAGEGFAQFRDGRSSPNLVHAVLENIADGHFHTPATDERPAKAVEKQIGEGRVAERADGMMGELAGLVKGCCCGCIHGTLPSPPSVDRNRRVVEIELIVRR